MNQKRNKSLSITLFAVLAFGCTVISQAQVEENYEDTKSAMANAAEETGDAISNAWDNIADFTVEQKQDFVDAMQNGYSELEAKAAELEEGSDNISDEIKAEFDKASAAFKEQLEKAGDASEDAWDSTKEGVQEAWGNLIDAFDEIEAEAESE